MSSFRFEEDIVGRRCSIVEANTFADAVLMYEAGDADVQDIEIQSAELVAVDRDGETLVWLASPDDRLHQNAQGVWIQGAL